MGQIAAMQNAELPARSSAFSSVALQQKPPSLLREDVEVSATSTRSPLILRCTLPVRGHVHPQCTTNLVRCLWLPSPAGANVGKSKMIR
jgi:hypothetical protein